MSDKEKPPPDDLAQSQRFIDMAREVEADESPEAFERAFAKVARKRDIKQSQNSPQSRDLDVT